MAWLKVNRAAKSLWPRVQASAALFGRVIRTWPNGFLILDPDNRPLYFFSNCPLFTPFTVSLSGPMDLWLSETRLKAGDHLLKASHSIFPAYRSDLAIALERPDLIDLQRSPLNAIPESGKLESWLDILRHEIRAQAKPEGLGSSVFHLPPARGSSRTSHAPAAGELSAIKAQEISELLTLNENPSMERFRQVFRQLVGLGPGLTPSGDDFLVGFLAPQRILDSVFWAAISQDGFRARLEDLARRNTTVVSAELISCALQGVFGEIVFELFECLGQNHCGEASSKIQKFLSWGGTSGADTAAGMVYGLASILRGESLDPLGHTKLII